MNYSDGDRQYAPATQRNRQPILTVLNRILPTTGNILEIASGTGEHASFFAPRLTPRHWIPSDQEAFLRRSIEAWREFVDAENLSRPLTIDARDKIWPVEVLDIPVVAIVNINMIHISPWSACLGLMAGAKRILPKGGILYLYGPFLERDKETASSNLSFDASLRSQNPEWGVRYLEEVVAVANESGLRLKEKVEMPANNLSVVFEKP